MVNIQIHVFFFFPPQLGIGHSCQDKFGLVCFASCQTCPYHERYCIPFPGIAFKEAKVGAAKSCLEKSAKGGAYSEDVMLHL